MIRKIFLNNFFRLAGAVADSGVRQERSAPRAEWLGQAELAQLEWLEPARFHPSLAAWAHYTSGSCPARSKRDHIEDICIP